MLTIVSRAWNQWRACSRRRAHRPVLDLPRSMRARRKRISQIDLAALTIKAWNAWISDAKQQPMRTTDTDRLQLASCG